MLREIEVFHYLLRMRGKGIFSGEKLYEFRGYQVLGWRLLLGLRDIVSFLDEPQHESELC